jgi:hypothetical protein
MYQFTIEVLSLLESCSYLYSQFEKIPSRIQFALYQALTTSRQFSLSINDHLHVSAFMMLKEKVNQNLLMMDDHLLKILMSFTRLHFSPPSSSFKGILTTRTTIEKVKQTSRLLWFHFLRKLRPLYLNTFWILQSQMKEKKQEKKNNIMAISTLEYCRALYEYLSTYTDQRTEDNDDTSSTSTSYNTYLSSFQRYLQAITATTRSTSMTHLSTQSNHHLIIIQLGLEAAIDLRSLHEVIVSLKLDKLYFHSTSKHSRRHHHKKEEMIQAMKLSFLKTLQRLFHLPSITIFPTYSEYQHWLQNQQHFIDSFQLIRFLFQITIGNHHHHHQQQQRLSLTMEELEMVGMTSNHFYQIMKYLFEEISFKLQRKDQNSLQELQEIADCKC